MSLQSLVDEVAAAVAPLRGQGRVADYIPALARVDPRQVGIAIADLDGATAVAGDADLAFSIQSVSKVFTLALALEAVGEDLWQRVGREPSGSAFNSIVQLEGDKGIPRNPLINAGALVVSDVLVAKHGRDAALATILSLLRTTSGDDGIAVDAEVAASEAETGFRNASLVNFMRAFGNVRSPVEEVLDLYFHHCAIAVTCRQLARAGLFLAAGGLDPIGGQRIVSAQRARRLAALMLTCGHYDASGDVAFRIGLPAKSGVGGGILAIVPGKAAVAVWSPGLSPEGNSLVGTKALELLVQRTGWSIFG